MLRWAAQAAWYEAVQGTGEKFTHNGKEQVMDKAWLQAYSKANGLNAPHNAALLAEYLNTRDPQALKQLTESLKKTPRRAIIERDQQAALDKSQVVTFLSGLTGVDYRQIMMDAGNPLDIASNFVPPLRGARAVGKVGGGIRRTITSALGSVAADLALESVNQAVENPNATLDDYLANGRNTVAAALGMHTAGAAAGKAAQRLTPNPPLLPPQTDRQRRQRRTHPHRQIHRHRPSRLQIRPRWSTKSPPQNTARRSSLSEKQPRPAAARRLPASQVPPLLTYPGPRWNRCMQTPSARASSPPSSSGRTASSSSPIKKAPPPSMTAARRLCRIPFSS